MKGDGEVLDVKSLLGKFREREEEERREANFTK